MSEGSSRRHFLQLGLTMIPVVSFASAGAFSASQATPEGGVGEGPKGEATFPDFLLIRSGSF